MGIFAPIGSVVEAAVAAGVQWLRLGVETVGAVVIAVGIVAVVATFSGGCAPPTPRPCRPRGTCWRHRARVPARRRYPLHRRRAELDQIGKLAAIRTALNFFLTREMREQTPGPAA